MEIINNKDNRFYLLESIWSKYNYDDIVVKLPGMNSTSYLIVPELVIKNFKSNKVNITNIIGSNNYISNRHFARILKITTGLTKQEYFDLVVLKINDTTLRPKCYYCGKYLSWSDRFSHGYFGDNNWMYHIHNYCDNVCKTKSMVANSNEYELFTSSRLANSKYLLDTKVRIKSMMNQFISRGNSDDNCVTYLAVAPNGNSKIGISSNIQFRSYNWNNPYKSYEVLYEGTRLECAYLEALVKLHYDQYREEFNIDKYDELKYTIEYYSKNIYNPFKTSTTIP